MRIAASALAVAAVFAGAAAGAWDPRSEKIRPRPADVALAKQAVLSQDDVGPDWVQLPTRKRDGSQFTCASFRPDYSRFTVTGQAHASFRQSGAQIDSSVAIFKTRVQAVGDFRLGAKPQLARCLASQLRQTFRTYPEGVRGTVLSSKMVRAPKLGEQAAGYAIEARLSGNGTTVPVFVDVFAVQRGRSIAALVFTALRSRLPSQRYFASAVTDRLR
jgi:hypothetical protein